MEPETIEYYTQTSQTVAQGQPTSFLFNTSIDSSNISSAVIYLISLDGVPLSNTNITISETIKGLPNFANINVPSEVQPSTFVYRIDVRFYNSGNELIAEAPLFLTVVADVVVVVESFYLQNSLTVTKGQKTRFIYDASNSMNASIASASITSTPVPAGVFVDSTITNGVKAITFGNVTIPNTLASGTYNLVVQFNNSNASPAATVNISVVVVDVYMVAVDGYSSGTLVYGNNTTLNRTMTSGLVWRPLSLNNAPQFFGAATSLSTLFSGQSYLSRDRIDALQSQVNSLNSLSTNALNTFSRNTTLYLKDFATEFNAFKGQITSSLATTISALALDEVQDRLLQSSISQLSNVEGSLFSAIAQKASLMTQNLTLAYTRNFVNVLLNVYPIYNSAGGADAGVCNVDDFFPEIVWGTTTPVLNGVSYANTDAYMTPDVVTATMDNISSNSYIYNITSATILEQTDAATSTNTTAAVNDFSVTSGTNLSDNGVI